MIIDCISDLHGFYPLLEGGDLLIIAGDITARDTIKCWNSFYIWLDSQKYHKKIYIGGNHDNFLTHCLNSRDCADIVYDEECEKQEYLCDSGTEFEGLKIWGSPWTQTFKGMNPKCKAFTVDTEEELEKKWDLIPEDTDILITHGPPKGILDWNSNGTLCGSESLLKYSRQLTNLKLFCFGHIHEAYSMININQLLQYSPNPSVKSLPIILNCSHVNERYQPVNKPIRIEI